MEFLPGKLGPVTHTFLPEPNEQGFRLEQDYSYVEIEDWEKLTGFNVTEPDGEPSFCLPLESVIARMGAKSQLRTFLVENFPPHHTYVEPFMGSVKMTLWKPESKIEIINDFDGDMASFFHHVRLDPTRLARYINAIPNHEAVVLGLRDLLAARKLRGIERAVAFYLGSQSAFNAKGDYSSYASSPHVLLDLSIDESHLIKVAKRLRRVNIRSTGYERIIRSCNKNLPAASYPPGRVFFYLDPPYWQTAGYKTFQGESAFGWKDQVNLANLCYEIDQMGNQLIQTNSDHDDLRALYGSFKRPDGTPVFHLEKVYVRYSMAGAGDARMDKGEFVISNFPLKSNVQSRQHSLFGAGR